MKSDGCNLLSGLDPESLSFGDDCQALGDALVKTSGNESQPHFPDSARSGIAAAIMYEVIDARARNLPPSLANVRAVLTQEPDKLSESVKTMIASGNFDIATRARKFLADNTEIQNIKSTIETQTAWMTKALRDDMATGEGLNFKKFATTPTTVYWIVPTPEIMPKAPYMRLGLSATLRALYREDAVPATLIVDEGFVLGHHAEIEAAASILPGFGSRFTIVFQSLMQAVGPRPHWQQQKRPRIPVGKMFGMPKGRALVWLPGDEAPRISWVKGYFEIPRLRRRASLNPYYKGASAKKKH